MVPQVDPENPQMISQGPSICIFNKEDPNEVMASWLFVQYMLTNEVQIAYSQTEGYVPVTTKAQESAEYQDYLSRAGEDEDTYYSVKIEAAKLVLENAELTFTTPVFNGSASVREAAGQLIESVTKAARRKQTVDDASISELYDETISLYRLDQLEGSGDGKKQLGELPVTSRVLLITLGVVWAGIAVVFFGGKIRNRRKKIV